MKRFLWALCFSAILLVAAQPVYAIPRIVENVVRNRAFFATFEEYSNCRLHDAVRIDDGRIGLAILSPLGFEIRLVVETGDRKTVLKDIFVPEKAKRDAMTHESILVADAVRLARFAIVHERRGSSN